MDKCSIEGWWWYSETSEITILCSKQTDRHFWSVLSCSKNTLFRAYCGENTRRPVWSTYVLRITMPIELCITYAEMLVFAHTRLAIVSGPLMPCWETTCIDFLYDAHLHPTFMRSLQMSDAFYESSFFLSQRSCMVETKCSSCSWVVSVFGSHQYCFCAVKICGHCTHQA